MHHDHRNPQLRRALTFITLAATLGLASITLTQCRVIDNSVTGVDLNSTGYHRGESRCDRQCKDKYKDCREDENRRHCRADRECDKIRNKKDRKDCQEKEEKRHKEELRACKELRDKCKKNCDYREGSGHGGR